MEFYLNLITSYYEIGQIVTHRIQIFKNYYKNGMTYDALALLSLFLSFFSPNFHQ